MPNWSFRGNMDKQREYVLRMVDERDIRFIFFQAKDVIRDFHVTGVQTCALPIAPHGRAVRQGVGTAALQDSTRAAIARWHGRIGHQLRLLSLVLGAPARRSTSTT